MVQMRARHADGSEQVQKRLRIFAIVKKCLKLLAVT